MASSGGPGRDDQDRSECPARSQRFGRTTTDVCRRPRRRCRGLGSAPRMPVTRVNTAASVATVATPALDELNSSTTVSLRARESAKVSTTNCCTSASTSLATDAPTMASSELSALTRASTAAGTDRIVQKVIEAATSPTPSSRYSSSTSLASCHSHRASGLGRAGGEGERRSISIR